MLENSVYIVVGVASGVASAFVVSTLGDLWTSALLPLCRRWWYRGPQVEGEWKGLGTSPTPASGAWSELALTLRQDARALHASLVLRDRSAGRSIDLDLRGKGTISADYLTLSLWPAGRAACSAASALLKIDAEDGALNGHLLYVDARGAMEAINVSVHRSGAIAVPRLLPALAGAADAGEGARALVKG